MTDTTLHWKHDTRGDEQYVAKVGDRCYIVRVFAPAAHDGDPKLTMYDDRYRSSGWVLIVWHGNDTKGLAWIFDNLADALIAAQDAADTDGADLEDEPDDGVACLYCDAEEELVETFPNGAEIWKVTHQPDCPDLDEEDDE